MIPSRPVIVVALGSTQTLAWASSYYLPAILGAPIAEGLGLPVSVFFGIFSASLLLAAVIGPAVGRMIDEHGGRDVLAASNLVIAAGLVTLAMSQGIVTLTIAWLLLSVGIAAGLYDSAFAALTALYGRDARNSITGITLIAGFASTIGWPASAYFEHVFGWRDACLIWAALNVFLAMPVNWFVIPAAPPPPPAARAAAGETRPSRRAGRCWCCRSSSRRRGSSPGRWRRICRACSRRPARPRPRRSPPAALVGPAQVAARLVEFGADARAPPADLGAGRGGAAPDRRRVPGGARRAGSGRLRAVATAPATA